MTQKLRGLFAAVILFSLWVLTACGQQAAGAPEIPEAQTERMEPVEAAGEEMAEEAEKESAVKTEFTKEELLADYDQIWEILEENYPFLPVLEEHGVDWQQLRTDYREKLAAKAPDLAAFVALIREMFTKMENFAHLQVVSQNLYAAYVEQANDLEALAGDPSSQLEVMLATGAQTAATYAQLEEQGALPRSTEDPEIDTAYYPDCKTAYFHIHGFPLTQLERDRTVIADYLASLEEVEHIIIDVTGNGGGYGSYLDEVVLYPFGESYSREDYYFFAKSPATEAYFWDAGLEPQSLSELPEDAAYPEFAEGLGMNYYLRYLDELDASEYDGPVIASDAKRWVLIDERCYSMADVFAKICKDTGWATLVGRPTAGDGCPISPKIMPLEHTGLLIRFSVGSSANSNGSLNVEAGTTPDYPCKKNELPLSKCLELIRNGQ